MKAHIVLFIKGFIIGIANIIPGVSGGTLAITLGLYERIIESVTHFFSKFKENLKFLIPIGIGAVLSILVLSKVLSFTLKNYEIETVLFFSGLILGGLPVLLNKVKRTKTKPKYFLTFLLTFLLVIAFALIVPKENYVSLAVLDFKQIILLFIVGIVAAATMVIPGISGSFVLMLIGYYKPIINVISDLTSFNNIIDNVLVLIPFGIGVVLGIFLIAKLIEILLKKYETITYYGIIGFVISSVVAILIPLEGFNIMNVAIGLVLFVIGYYGAYKLSKFE